MPKIRPWLLVAIILLVIGAYVFLSSRPQKTEESKIRSQPERVSTKESAPTSQPERVSTEAPAFTEPVLTIAGQVRSSDGTPIENAEVNCVSTTGAGYGGSTSDAQGTFTMTDLAPGTYSVTVEQRTHDPATLTVEYGAYAPATIERVYLDSQDPFKWLEVTLPLGAFLSGKVTDDEDVPVHASVDIEALHERAGTYIHFDIYPGPIELASGFGAGTTDDEGRYSTSPLPPGAYKVTADYYGYYDAEPKIVKLAAGEKRLDIDLVLKKRRAFISGKVVDTDGNPLADASVYIAAPAPDYFSETLHTDADGTFSLQGIVPAKYGITGRADGFVAKEMKVTAPADNVLIELRRGGTIKGRVVDKATGRPIDDFVTHLEPYFSPTQKYDEGGAFEYGGLGTGFYSLFVGAPGYAETAAHGIRVREGTETSGILVELQAIETATVIFNVTSARDGSPVDGACVSWSTLARDGNPFAEREAKTDAEGHCTAEGLEPGLHNFTVRGPQHEGDGFVGDSFGFDPCGDLPHDLDEPTEEFQGPGEPSESSDTGEAPNFNEFAKQLGFGAPGEFLGDLNNLTEQPPEFAPKVVTVLIATGDRQKEVAVALDPTFTLRGYVVSKADGRPIWGAMVSMENLPEETLQRDLKTGVETDRQGAFAFDGVMPGSCTFQIRHDGYAIVERQFHITEPPTEDLIIEISVGGHIFGTVLDPDGAPVPYAVVGTERSNARTDEEGNYSLAHVLPGWQCVDLSLEGAAYAGLTCKPQEVVVNEGESVRVDFHLVYGATVAGKLTRYGEPIEGAKLELRSEKTPASYAYTRTGEGGAYRFEPILPPGAYTMDIELNKSEHGYAGTYHRRVEIGDGDNTLDVELGGSRVSGVVLGRDGQPLRGAFVGVQEHVEHADRLTFLFSVHEEVFTTYSWTAGDGTFRLDSVPPGSYRLVASPSGYAPQSVPLGVSAEGDISAPPLTLGKGLALQARARTYDDAPAPQLHCYVYDEQGVQLDESLVEPDPETGTFTIEGFGPGRFRVCVRPEISFSPKLEARYAPITLEIPVARDQEVAIELHFKEAHQLNALLVDEDGKEVGGALVVLDPGGDAALARALNDVVFFNELCRRPHSPVPEKGIALYGIPDGDYTLHVRCDGYEDAAVPVRIAGSDKQVTVTLKPGNVKTE